MAQKVDSEGGIAAGDQNGDICVVDHAPQGFCLRFPPNSVINGATGEEGDGRERENA
jgi:hypothetical protein